MPLMWDNVTEIKCNIFGRVWFLKNYLFFECLYFSEYDIRMLLFIFWLTNRPSIKYVRNWAGQPKCVQVRTARGELKNRSYDTYVLNGWPQTKSYIIITIISSMR